MDNSNVMPNGDRYIEGTEGCHAIVRPDSNVAEIWCEDFERKCGYVPANYTGEQINLVLRFYREGEKRGIETGKREKQQEVLAALGITEAIRKLELKLEP